MGRELKRVALDFDWELGKIWKGYQNPHNIPCSQCSGTGLSRAGALLDDITMDLARAVRISRGETGRNHYSAMNHQMPETDTGFDPELKMLLEKATGREIKESSAYYGGHPIAYEIQEMLFQKAGIKRDEWGFCTHCEGEGISPDHLEDYEEWESYEPPSGEGWQVWENVSEGSPITPVFKTDQELIEHLSSKGTSWNKIWSKKGATNFVKNSGYAPSAIGTSDGKIMPGYEFVSE